MEKTVLKKKALDLLFSGGTTARSSGWIIPETGGLLAITRAKTCDRGEVADEYPERYNLVHVPTGGVLCFGFCRLFTARMAAIEFWEGLDRDQQEILRSTDQTVVCRCIRPQQVRSLRSAER